MQRELLKPFTPDFAEYLRDESRSVGNAQSISFPESEGEVIEALSSVYENNIQITIQGGRTGLAAAAVPYGGHIMNMTRMDKITGMGMDEAGSFFLKVQPGVILSKLAKQIEDKRFDTDDWDSKDKQAHRLFCDGPRWFFSPDPTESSATIGGMAACNASGARSYLYGPVRNYIEGLRLVLCNGQTISLKRGEVFAENGRLSLTTEQGETIDISLPTYKMPDTKNASGYYIKPDMDAVDLFIGSDGTLGVITEMELRLLPLPEVIWGVTCFFKEEGNAIDFVAHVREKLNNIAAIEYFDANVLNLLKTQREENQAFAALPEIPEGFACAIYLELHCNDEKCAYELLFQIGGQMAACGGREDDTWVARTAFDRDKLIFFRHAAPEIVNMIIDRRKKANPIITKLGTDMAVPHAFFKQTMEMYHNMLKERGLQYAVWGHIGNSHVHVNILPKNEDQYLMGKELYAFWAKNITDMGGSVSAEHGVGKLKANFLALMYGEKHINEMAGMKYIFDPKGLLGVGNLFETGKWGVSL